jgi:hypothetical protein
MCLREKIGPDPRNFNQRVSLGRNDLLIRTFLDEGRLAPRNFLYTHHGDIRSAFAKKTASFSGFTQTKGTGIHYKRGLSDRRIDIKYGVFSTPSFKVLISLRFIFKALPVLAILS